MRLVDIVENPHSHWDKILSDISSPSPNYKFQICNYESVTRGAALRLFAIQNTKNEWVAAFPVFSNKDGPIGKQLFPIIRNDAPQKELFQIKELFLSIFSSQLVTFKWLQINQTCQSQFNILPILFSDPRIQKSEIQLQVVPLKRSYSRNFSRSLKKEIRRKARCNHYRIEVITENDDLEKQDYYFQIYRNLHFIAAGRQTRSNESFDRQREIIRAGFGELFVAYWDDVAISVLMCSSLKGGVAVGFSQANHKDYWQQSPRHALEAYAIQYYADQGFEYYLLGEYPMDENIIRSMKLRNIMAFKKKYGPETMLGYEMVAKL
jgi:hypothetical protein